MKHIIALTPKKETPGTFMFAEVEETGKPPVVKSAYVKKYAAQRGTSRTADFTKSKDTPGTVKYAEISGFREYLSDRDIDIPDLARSFGGNVYFSLSGNGCGFWDDESAEHLQTHLEAYSGSKYRFEQIDICEDETGKLDIAILPEFIAKYRRKMFAVESEVTK